MAISGRLPERNPPPALLGWWSAFVGQLIIVRLTGTRLQLAELLGLKAVDGRQDHHAEHLVQLLAEAGAVDDPAAVSGVAPPATVVVTAQAGVVLLDVAGGPARAKRDLALLASDDVVLVLPMLRCAEGPLCLEDQDLLVGLGGLSDDADLDEEVDVIGQIGLDGGLDGRRGHHERQLGDVLLGRFC